MVRTPPDDEDDLKDEKKNGELNLSFDEMSEFQSVIDPPSKKTSSHCKGRGDRSQDKKIETRDLEERVLKEEMENNEEGGSHQKGNGKVDNHWVGMAPRHGKSL